MVIVTVKLQTLLLIQKRVSSILPPLSISPDPGFSEEDMTTGKFKYKTGFFTLTFHNRDHGLTIFMSLFFPRFSSPAPEHQRPWAWQPSPVSFSDSLWFKSFFYVAGPAWQGRRGVPALSPALHGIPPAPPSHLFFLYIPLPPPSPPSSKGGPMPFPSACTRRGQVHKWWHEWGEVPYSLAMSCRVHIWFNGGKSSIVIHSCWTSHMFSTVNLSNGWGVPSQS